MPLLRVFTGRDLVESLTRAGFVLERQWRPGKRQAVFLIAVKPTHEDARAAPRETATIAPGTADEALVTR